MQNSDNSDVSKSLANFPFSGGLSGRKGFNSRLSQLFVFLTGVILTLLVYTLLGLFVENIISEEHDRVLTDTRSEITNDLTELGRTVETVAMILALSRPAEQTTVVSRIPNTVAGINQFEEIVLLAKQNGRWASKEIYRNGDGEPDAQIFERGSEETLSEYILMHRRPISNLIAISDLPGTSFAVEDIEPLVKARPFVMAYPVFSRNPELGIVVGVSKLSNIVDDKWLAQRRSLQRFILRDTDTGRRLFYMERGSAKQEIPETSDFESGNNISVGQANWQVYVTAGTDSRMVLLSKAPNIFLLFGLIFTLGGTVFVRNNQKQSFQLLAMNRTLAQKNYDLNGQIAERERLNHSIRKVEREYRAIIDAISDVIFEVSADGTLLFLNETWLKVTGLNLSDSLDKNLFSFIHPQDRDEQWQSFSNMIKGKKHAYRTFTRIATQQGQYRSVELAISMLRQDENHNLRVVGSLTDVEERRRAERALSEAEKKYREIVENAAGGIFQITPEGQFLSANPAMARILGYESADELISNIHDIHHQLYGHSKEHTRFLKDLVGGGPARHREILVRKKDGSEIWVYENIRAVTDDDNNVVYYEGSMEDITKRKEVEIKLREAKIQSDLASRAKSEFLANMSHELRTPLNAIIGFSEIIKSEVLGPLGNEQYNEYVSDIYQSGNRLLTIINEILDVSHIEAGERQLNESVVDLNKVAASCIDFMTAKASDHGLGITNMLDSSVPDVIGEELAIKQILLNLLSNAIKFTQPGGRVTMSWELDNKGDLRLSVTDTGIGLDETEIEKALSPFGQVSTSSLHRTETTGVGLGLTLVDSMIKLHGGRLELFSQKGIGTTVTIIFPKRRVSGETGNSEKNRQPAI